MLPVRMQHLPICTQSHSIGESLLVNRLTGDELRRRDRDAEGVETEVPKALRARR